MNPSLETAELLAQIGRENDLAEIDYEDATVKIHITFDAPPAVGGAAFDSAALMANFAVANAAAANRTLSASAAPVGKIPETGDTINSPLAGVFYRAPRPDADPFVSQDGTVSAGQVLCIVEAMKLMNEITAERPCKIVKILVENAEVVEEGQPLFLIS